MAAATTGNSPRAADVSGGELPTERPLPNPRPVLNTSACGSTALRLHLFILIVALFTGLIHSSGHFSSIERLLSEIRFNLHSRAPTGSIVIVEIDARSIDAVGQWPWPRSVHAQLVQSLSDLGALDIAFDVDFSSISTEREDQAFEEALGSSNASVALAAHNDVSPSGIVPVRPIERFASRSWPVSVNVTPDSDGQVRHYPSGHLIAGEYIRSMAVYLAGRTPVAQDVPVDFSIAADEIPRISAIDLLRGNVARSSISGRRVLVGASALALRDFFKVPRYRIVPGVVLQALAAETLLQDRVLREAGNLPVLLGLGVLSLLAGFLLPRFDWRAACLLFGLVALSVEALAATSQALRQIVVDTSAWHVALVGFLALAIVREVDVRGALITALRRESRATRLLLSQVVSDNLEGIIIADERGIILSISRAAVALLQPGSTKYWPGEQIADFVPSELAAAVHEALGTADGSQSRTPQELSVAGFDGEDRVIEYVITVSKQHAAPRWTGKHSATHSTVCLTFRDVTERRRNELRLAAAKEAAEQASQAKSDFLASMSHEVRTPLNAILGSADILLDSSDVAPHLRRFVQHIHVAGTALLAVVNDVLDFSSMEAGHLRLSLRSVSPRELVDEAISIVQGAAAQKDLALDVTFRGATPAAVLADPDRLRQVLLNLLQNAIKFTPVGGVCVDVETLSLSGELWSARFSVTDTGIGIPTHMHPRVFQRFSQVDGSLTRRFGGTGLGLAISKNLIEAMGGEISFSSEAGRGSTFWFSLAFPLAHPRSPSRTDEGCDLKVMRLAS